MRTSTCIPSGVPTPWAAKPHKPIQEGFSATNSPDGDYVESYITGRGYHLDLQSAIQQTNKLRIRQFRQEFPQGRAGLQPFRDR